MPINPANVCLFIPPELKKFKLDLFERIGSKIEKAGGRVARHDVSLLEQLPENIVPIVGCSFQLRHIVKKWQTTGRKFIYWDRGYVRRVFATWLPRGDNGGFYRWHINSFQLARIGNFPDDRWRSMRTDVLPWNKNGRHIVIAAPSRSYARFHQCENWIADTIDELARVTDRQLVIRDKESKRPLQTDLHGAHALVTHGSIAAVEAVILGCPVFVNEASAASLVGGTNLSMVEKPKYPPDRQPWLNALAYSQFSEAELVDGTLWRTL